eukprot:TRINITY_DN5665_c0_g1_i9.p1 TRINITY_DN5665_c0_g1~~TRINITY_DN5665_c0_g1_i9.p1  ORF type:complete len:101 (-),score=14.81 TRINITY_DN5665_c0_g1_i9:283-585(-)
MKPRTQKCRSREPQNGKGDKHFEEGEEQSLWESTSLGITLQIGYLMCLCGCLKPNQIESSKILSSGFLGNPLNGVVGASAHLRSSPLFKFWNGGPITTTT